MDQKDERVPLRIAEREAGSRTVDSQPRHGLEDERNERDLDGPACRPKVKPVGRPLVAHSGRPAQPPVDYADG